MALLLCILSGPAKATKIKHIIARTGGIREKMPPPVFLIIDGEPNPPYPRGSGVMLYRFDAKGDCVGDTWHESYDKAKKDAGDEYEGLVQQWEEIPLDVDMVEYGIARLAK